MTRTHALSPTRLVGAVRIVPAKPGDLPAILGVLHTVNLPTAGVDTAMPYFWVAKDGERVAGCVGLEVYADLALLRSVAVLPEQQGSGLGRALTEVALEYITARQYRTVYLLTTTAAAFFAGYGFRPMARSEVAASVQQSVELQSVCPDTATCMALIPTYAPAALPSELTLRAARFGDVPAIQDIHNQGILDRVATLDTEPRTAQDSLAWFHHHGPRHPVIVAASPHGIAGWTSLNVFNARQAYQYVADLSVYIARPWRGKGIGGKLLAAIIAIGQTVGYHKIVLSAFPNNQAGMRLYERHGFTSVGIYKEMGWLDGKWVDTIIMERLLNDA